MDSARDSVKDSVKTVAVELSLFSEPSQDQNSSGFSRLAEALGIPIIRVRPESVDELIPQIHQASNGYDFIIIGHCDSEFYHAEENRKLWEKLIRYDVDIGFGDSFPEGVIAEFFRRETLPVMENIRRQNQIPVKRDVFAKIIAVDYNTFDLENHYPPVSLRTLRLSFFSDNLQDRIIKKRVKEFFPEGKRDFLHLDYTEFANTILKNRSRLRTHPRYYEIAITNRSVQRNAYLPALDDNYDMSLTDFKVILDKIIPFAGKPVISLSGLGEMTTHPQWQDFVEEVLKRDQECILETAGMFWTREVSSYWLNHPHKHNLTVIFKVEAVDEGLYRKIRGDAFPLAEILDNIEYYLLRNPQQSYVETVKTTETFKHLPAYHDYFSRYTQNIIIGKYNTYRGVLPERRINPMKPYEKIDCWHLKRDFKIDPRGEVWLCKQDVGQEYPQGNLIREEIETIHERGQTYFEKQAAGWDFCKDCDEFYTYNF